MTPSEAIIRQRAAKVLRALGLYSEERLAAILVLSDHSTPSPVRAMARVGMTPSDGLPNKKLLDAVRSRMGLSPKDREGRDQVQLPLREVGIIGKGLFEPQQSVVLPDIWRSKSNYCLYVLQPGARELLWANSDEEFQRLLPDWLADTDNRKSRIASAEAAAAAAMAGGRLVPLTIERYCKVFLPGYRVIFVDDADGARIPDLHAREVADLNVPLNLDTRWPDIILYKDDTQEFWIVDCVESDGEVDYVRRDEMLVGFEERNLTVAGFTTAYRTMKRFHERQLAHDNIADRTFVWIMEIGGSHFLKLPASAPL